jgi:hypothetical protein
MLVGFSWVARPKQQVESFVWANGLGAFAETKAQEDDWVMHCKKSGHN